MDHWISVEPVGIALVLAGGDSMGSLFVAIAFSSWRSNGTFAAQPHCSVMVTASVAVTT